MKFARLTRVTWVAADYRNATVWINFDHVAGMSNASAEQGGGAFLKMLLPDSSTGEPSAGPTDGMFGKQLAPPEAPLHGEATLYIPLTRYDPAPPPDLGGFSDGFDGGGFT